MSNRGAAASRKYSESAYYKDFTNAKDSALNYYIDALSKYQGYDQDTDIQNTLKERKIFTYNQFVNENKKILLVLLKQKAGIVILTSTVGL